MRCKLFRYKHYHIHKNKFYRVIGVFEQVGKYESFYNLLSKIWNTFEFDFFIKSK